MTEQVGDKMKPDSQKSTTEKMGDTLSGAGDRVAGTVQPEYVSNLPVDKTLYLTNMIGPRSPAPRRWATACVLGPTTLRARARALPSLFLTPWLALLKV